ncbi:MAG: type II toxin-antitoxin system VapB family antitoxin [Candidatus Eisenbacteria bacterium]|nr:type II toxin-antitoxin system VapB family antitoxin [Candidatus Eisenbacteria bacterium]MCC7141988.1 type II toxin-antitoxin system VapB family antitoxin [Candidatus Eisenbacteria bacterium]
MRTTLDLNDELLAAAKRRAKELGTTLKAVVEKALAADLAEKPPVETGFRLEWTPHEGPLRAGIDLADRDSLYDAMEDK